MFSLKDFEDAMRKLGKAARQADSYFYERCLFLRGTDKQITDYLKQRLPLSSNEKKK